MLKDLKWFEFKIAVNCSLEVLNFCSGFELIFTFKILQIKITKTRVKNPMTCTTSTSIKKFQNPLKKLYCQQNKKHRFSFNFY